MKVTFIATDPRQKARPLLDDILERGVDQIAISCAFLTGGGVEVLKRHASRLKLSDSFVVVAWMPPTDLTAVEDMHRLCPGNVYVHLGAQTPVEKGVGPGLMHSKVFMARAGTQCWLWTGSHNLTASAALGVNCEAAVLLEGSVDEQPFRDALAHLSQCKQEAIVFDPFHPPPLPSGQDTLVVHAECHVGVGSPPWFVHLRPATTRYDQLMRPPASVWLYLYQPGTLHLGMARPRPMAAYSGTLTALNFTEHHPDRGIPADWEDANYVIEQEKDVFHLSGPRPQAKTPTQCVFRVEAQEARDTLWLTESPAPKVERVVGETWTEEIDPEFRRFFTPRSLKKNRLVHRQYRDTRVAYSVTKNEVGDLSSQALVRRLGMEEGTEVHVEGDRTLKGKFAFIYRARYRA